MLDSIPPELQEDLVRILLAVIAFAVVWLLRHLLVNFTRRVLLRFSAFKSESIRQGINEVINWPVSIVTLALAIDISARILALDQTTNTFAFRITQTLVIFAVVLLLYRLIGTMGQSRSRLYSFTGLSIDNTLLPFVRTGLHLVLLAIGAIILIDRWGYDVTGLVAGLGLGGLAISLAAQDTLSNVFGFSMIVSDRPFVVGEFIKTPDVEGVVERVGLRSTSVRQLNQAVVTIPNSKLASAPILNWSRLSKRWIDFTLGINYGASPEQLETMMAQIREMLAAREAVDESSVVVHFIEFGDNALRILVRAYVKRAEWLAFTKEREQVNLEIMRIVKNTGLTIAYPSRSLYIEKLPDVSNEVRDGLRNLSHEVLSSDSKDPRS
jgi:MscS family membrane protein